jgi:hypothetical protein
MQKQTLMALSILISCSFVYAESTITTPDTKPKTNTEQTTKSDTDTKSVPSTAPETESKDSSSTDMSKKTWLDTVVPMLPSLICKGFMDDADLKQRLDAIKMNYDQCVTAIPASVDKCRTQLYSSIPDKITNTDAATWGKTLGECIGKDFATKYLLPK